MYRFKFLWKMKTAYMHKIAQVSSLPPTPHPFKTGGLIFLAAHFLGCFASDFIKFPTRQTNATYIYEKFIVVYTIHMALISLFSKMPTARRCAQKQ